MLISLTSLATMSKFQKNICFKTRAVGLIKIKTKECKWSPFVKVVYAVLWLADFKFLLLLWDLGSWVCSGCKVKTPGRKRKGQAETPITSPPRRKIQPHSTTEGSFHG